jgi:hypothetical protein
VDWIPENAGVPGGWPCSPKEMDQRPEVVFLFRSSNERSGVISLHASCGGKIAEEIRIRAADWPRGLGGVTAVQYNQTFLDEGTIFQQLRVCIFFP